MRALLLLGTILFWIAPVIAAELSSRCWAAAVQFPKTEKPIALFNGRNLAGWEGQIEKHWSVDGGAIRGANDESVPASTYLFTRESYRHFRLLLEVRQTRSPKYSTMHSAVAVLGEKMEDQGDPFGFKGPLLLFCEDWGIWDANRRQRVFPAKQVGFWQTPIENVGEWNRIEILILGDRIRMAANGQLFMDYTDQPGMLKQSPIGLQLHANNQPQEFHFRGLVLAQDPEDRMLTLTSAAPATGR